MSLPLQVITAFLLDLIIGDPRSYPHPVKVIAKIALACENFTRGFLKNKKVAGIITTLLVVLASYCFVYFIIALLNHLHPFAGIAGSIFFIYASLSVRNLFEVSLPIQKFLSDTQLPEARKSLSNIVGRDTQNLDEQGILRATVETIAESTVDGIISPLFYAVIGGAPLAISFKAVSTMDSLFGYKNEKYLEFGWAPARLDDLANWIPARISIPFMTLGAVLGGGNGKNAWKIACRDGHKHPSPNSGIPEAAMAGALGIQLGGSSFYSGIENNKPLLGDPINKSETLDITKSHKIMFASSCLALVIFSGLLHFYLII